MNFIDDIMGEISDFSNSLIHTFDHWTASTLPSAPVESQSTETTISYLVDVPGVKEENLDIAQEGHAVKIRASRNNRNYRSSLDTLFTVSKEAKLDTLQASLADGVLTLTYQRQPKISQEKVRVNTEVSEPKTISASLKD